MTTPKNYLIDMDGVLVRGRTLIPGADVFIRTLIDRQAEFLVLTNNPRYTPADLSHRLGTMGLQVPLERIFSSAMATALFLQSQQREGTAFVLGESGLTSAIHGIGYVITDLNPDYVVLGEGSFDLEQLTKAIRLVAAGAHFLATNPDPSGPGEGGTVPACGAMAAFIEKASGVTPYFVGKPNPLMMRTALNYLDVHSEDTIMVGDTMATDIKGGVESGMDTILVLTGVTRREDITRFPFQPTHVMDSVADIVV
ncbi:HAD-IIA family hydrolase [Promineifilum sp.]|uniref:HAD-IIA family hydrolase n=1 Tax=Promineifilum sp. TaxID=2664178 RepID=UPI0035AE2837